MRRFIAYLSLVITSLIIVGTTFAGVFTQTTSSLDFSTGKELVFRISEFEENEYVDNERVNEIASIMDERMKNYGSTRYQVITEGNDTIKVKVSEPYSEQYEQIKTYLSFDGSFALGTSSNVIATGEEFLVEGKESYVTFSGVYPTIVIPVNKDNDQFKAVIAEANELSENAQAPAEGEEAPQTFVYLAHNFDIEKDQMSEIIQGNEDFNEDKADKLLMQFAISSIWLDENENAIATMVDIDTDGDGAYSPLDVSKGNELAKYYVNLLNSKALPCNVDFIFENDIAPIYENLISLDNHRTVAFSNLFIATLFAIVIISLLLAIFYRLGAFAIAALSIGSTYLAMVFNLLFSVEFNVASVIGLIGVAIVSLVSSIIYLTKVKEECYHGRTLKKANAEGAKKALLPIVDINVLIIIIGAAIYWLGGSMLTSLAASFVFGGIASLILNTLILRGLMWLLTNTTSFTGKYGIIGVENEKVPNIMNEEKQTYFGPFQDKDFTSKKKPVGFAFIALLIAALAGTITFGVMNNGSFFATGNYSKDTTYLYVETTTEDSAITQSYVENYLANTYVVKDNKETKINVSSIKTYTREEVEEEVVTTYTYIVATLAPNYTATDAIVIKDADGQTLYTGTLDVIFENVVEDAAVDANATSSFKVGTKVNKQQPDMSWILIATAVGAGFAFVYMSLRYGLQRGLASLLGAGATSAITIGFFVLTRIVALNDIIIALPLVALITLMFAIIHGDKEKELVKEDFARTKDNSSAHRYEIMLKANPLSAGPILSALILILFIAVNFFGIGTNQMALTFVFVIIGSGVGAIFVTTLFGPLSSLFYKLFKRINMPKINIKRKKHKKVRKVKSGEPEEAIFIGMND